MPMRTKNNFIPEVYSLEMRNERIDLRDATQDTELMEYGH